MLKSVIAAGAAFAAIASPALAGEWVLNPAKCPDLVEDKLDRFEDRVDRRENRRDERFDRGPRDVREDRRDRAEDRIDRRENRRDERVTVCPASAWDYKGRRFFRPGRPAAAAVYWDGGGYYWRKPDGVRVAVVVK
ncbi:MAG: hypothetical protein AAFR11_06500 [Pseudomonadota bacterium]